MDKYGEVLKLLVDKLLDVEFVLIGSMDLRFQGIEINANDIDLLTNDLGINKIAKIYNSKITENAEKKYLETKFTIDSRSIKALDSG